MPKQRQGELIGGAIAGATMVVGAASLFVLVLGEWTQDDPILGGIALALAVGGAWAFGARHGHKAEFAARRAENDARRERAATRHEAAQARLQTERDREQARQAKLSAEEAERRAQDSERVFRAKSANEDLNTIRKTRDLPLPERIEAATTIGSYAGEDAATFTDRRDAVLRERVDRWEKARRIETRNHELLAVVERQKGLCGDRSRSDKGCGCYLYALPSTAVHLDHIKPRAEGGSDEIENMQALCSLCNTRAGARTE